MLRVILCYFYSSVKVNFPRLFIKAADNISIIEHVSCIFIVLEENLWDCFFP